MADSEANELATILSESLAANTPKMGKKKLDDEYTLVFSNEYRTKDDKANALYFYSLNDKGGKMVKILIGGELFLQYNSENNELAYLVNKQQ